MKQRLILVTFFIAIAIAMGLVGFSANLATIATPSLDRDTTVENITDGNSTEILAPSEEGVWG